MREHKGRIPWPPELSEQLREVDRMRRGGRYDAALARLRALAEAHPLQVRVLTELAQTLAVWGRAPAEALPWFERVLELAPGHLTSRFHRGLARARLGLHEEAVADFDTVATTGPRRLLVLFMKRAESLHALGRHEEAERDWTQALVEDPGNTWLLQQRAQARARLGLLDEALADLTQALDTRAGAPADAELLHERGVLRARRGDTTGAREDFEAGLRAYREGDPAPLLDALRKGLRETPGEAR
ncbi:tetratricopeptide repeat protein [Myxococcaceae bacterium GXIMD 01537]